MAQLIDIIGPQAQSNFEQRIFRRARELDIHIPGAFMSLQTKPLLSFTIGELLIIADGLDTTVEWLLTGELQYD